MLPPFVPVQSASSWHCTQYAAEVSQTGVKPAPPVQPAGDVQPAAQKPVLVLQRRPASLHWLLPVHCTQVFVVVLQVWAPPGCPAQLVSLVHCTQRLVVVLHALAPAVPAHWVSLVQVTMLQVLVAVSQAVPASPHWVSLTHWTHWLVAVSHVLRVMWPEQSVSAVQATQIPFDVSQIGVAAMPAHCVLLVQGLKHRSVAVSQTIPASPHWVLLVHCTHAPAEEQTRLLVHCESIVQATHTWPVEQCVRPPPMPAQSPSARHCTQALVAVSQTGVRAPHIPLSVQGIPAVPPELLLEDESAPPSPLPDEDPVPDEPDEVEPDEPDDEETVLSSPPSVPPPEAPLDVPPPDVPPLDEPPGPEPLLLLEPPHATPTATASAVTARTLERVVAFMFYLSVAGESSEAEVAVRRQKQKWNSVLQVCPVGQL